MRSYLSFIKSLFNKLCIAIVLLSATSCFLHGEGFGATTLVKIAVQKYVPIDQLHVGDYLLTYDFETQRQELQQITAIEYEQVSHLIRFTFDNCILDVASEQSFYIPPLQQWMTAQQLCDNPLVALMLCPAIKDVEIIEHNASVIKITVAHNHTFYVTDNDLLTHNYAEAVLLYAGSSAGPAAATAISVCCVVYYTYQFFKWLKHSWQCRNAHHHTSCNSNIQNNATVRTVTNSSPQIQNKALAKQHDKQQSKLPVPPNNNNQQPTQNPQDPNKNNKLLQATVAASTTAEHKDEIKQVVEAAQKYIEANGFKFTEFYYKRLWETGRKVPGFRAEQILKEAKVIIPDPRGYEGFFKYVSDTWEMIYNPTTKVVSHMEPL